ncbi:glycosyltransferase family 1 protein [Oceanobacillus arenosus]|uniref:Glycosyltransferase family 1 protein n=1 Tax=Oceanobacillus arenosus TaxID=1229153 RepID=A0A3D8PS21_9BACI|nr:glycosyltransferase family 1 protein [Oceanobacillus arenosus]RDW18512.1 glycosyltransferase family 1 protein [Oceanobacillus arenosus]
MGGIALKIAIFTDTYAPDVNGVAKTLERLTSYLEDNHVEYRVFAPRSAVKKDLFSQDVYRFVSLPLFLYKECSFAIPNMLQIREELLEFQPDMIHVATPFNLGLCGLHYAKKLDIPIVGSYHTDFDKYLEYYDLQFLSKVLWKYMHWFHRPLRKIFVPSIDTKEQLQRQGFTNLSIWPRGVDCSIFNPNYDTKIIREKFNITEKYLLLYVGRISPEKDVMLLPEINKQLPDEVRENVHWLIVGDGPVKKELEDSTIHNLSFAGFLEKEELAAAYAAADLFVFPSVTETFGNVVLESMASGTPVIGANAGGVRTIIENDVTGKLCPEKNVEAFVDAITGLLSSEEKRRSMSLEGVKYAQSQSWDLIFSRLLTEYEDALVEEVYKVLA